MPVLIDFKIQTLFQASSDRISWKMAKGNDPRRELGARVTAKATVVSSQAECKRLFGSLCKTKRVTGVITDVVKDCSGKHKQTSFVVEWEIAGKKLCCTKLCNIKIEGSEENHDNNSDNQTTPTNQDNSQSLGDDAIRQ